MPECYSSGYWMFDLVHSWVHSLELTPSPFIHRRKPNTTGSFHSRKCKCKRVKIYISDPSQYGEEKLNSMSELQRYESWPIQHLVQKLHFWLKSVWRREIESHVCIWRMRRKSDWVNLKYVWPVHSSFIVRNHAVAISFTAYSLV